MLAFEVKHRRNVDRDDAAHLVWLRDQLGTRFGAGFVVHSGGDVYPIADGIVAIPFSTLTRPDAASRT